MNRYYLLSLFLFSVLSVRSQHKFKVTGKVESAKNGTVMYLITIPPGNVDSAVVHNGAFTFTGDLDQPTEALLVPGPLQKLEDPERRKFFWIDAQPVYVNGNVLHFKDAVVKGGTAQKNYLSYMKGLPMDNDSLQIAYIVSFLSEHPYNYKAVQELFMKRKVVPVNTIKGLYSNFPDSIRKSTFASLLHDYISATQTLKTGESAPDFTLNNMSHQPTSLSSFRGNYVLLNFWSSTCGPCRKKNPLLNEAYKAYRDKNFVILGVGLDKHDQLEKAIQKDKVQWLNTYDSLYFNSKVAVNYNIPSIPYTLLLDPEGRILIIQPELQHTSDGYVFLDKQGNVCGKLDDMLQKSVTVSDGH